MLAQYEGAKAIASTFIMANDFKSQQPCDHARAKTLPNDAEVQTV